MATRTEPIRLLLFLFRGAGRVRGHVRWERLALVVAPLRRDQLIQPPHLALHGLQAVSLQFERVAVEPLPGAGERGTYPFQALLQPAAPALEDAHPYCRVGPGEEREVDAEVLVLPRGRSGLGQQPLEMLLTLGGELVDDLGALARQGQGSVRQRHVLRAPAAAEQVLETRVQRAVRERAERAEQGVETLAQLVSVHGGLVQQAEDGEFENVRSPAHLSSSLAVTLVVHDSGVSIASRHRYIRVMCRHDVSHRYI